MNTSSTLKAHRPSKSKAVEEVKKEETERLNIELPASLKRDLKIQAARDGVKLKDLTIRLINEYLSKSD